MTPSFRRKKTQKVALQDVSSSPQHGKINAASVAGQSRRNQPLLRSYIDCCTTSGWTLAACHLRALTEILPYSKGGQKLQVVEPYHFGSKDQAFQKRFTSFHHILLNHPPSCLDTPLHCMRLSARWKQSSRQKYKSNQDNWRHKVWVGVNNLKSW